MEIGVCQGVEHDSGGLTGLGHTALTALLPGLPRALGGAPEQVTAGGAHQGRLVRERHRGPKLRSNQPYDLLGISRQIVERGHHPGRSGLFPRTALVRVLRALRRIALREARGSRDVTGVPLCEAHCCGGRVRGKVIKIFSHK